MHNIKLKGSDKAYIVGKIVCLGRNYLEHIRELNNEVPDQPVIFCKPGSSILKNHGQVVIPAYSNDCHHELELAVLIGKNGKHIPETEAMSYVCGYGVALDLTLRDVQARQKEKGLPWEIAKGFDTSCPLSDFVPAAQVGNPDNLEICLKVNGVIRQQGNSNMMMRSVAQIISEISTFFTLEEGDIILTGTPSGVGPIQSGDILDGEIEQVGSLRVSVA
ncbi:fumarylacetoacetate hydrolase family protein [Geopsychrobacter electrodiphilus]|uniref:fumarylacetoacetate hydrolase family protein n=1 Tax=Geopsychrobacter electrodiphilus TaxID=225196 RepID=UPI000380375A|nr:fumarylacetoacetate hydrolase family protein [Geopsychrobacter electrodiphilus]